MIDWGSQHTRLSSGLAGSTDRPPPSAAGHSALSISASARRACTAGTAWRQFLAIFGDPNLLAVTAFCAIGFLITICFILRFPDFGALVAEYNLF